MFATHLASPLQPSLVSHVFGRFMARTPSAGRAGSAPGGAAAVPAAPALPVVLEDELPDLAQRVRELGEW